MQMKYFITIRCTIQDAKNTKTKEKQKTKVNTARLKTEKRKFNFDNEPPTITVGDFLMEVLVSNGLFL
jgi:hypothetical protein